MDPVEISLAFALILFVLCYNINRLLGLPPGPTPWPIVGNTFQMPKTDLDKHFLDLRKQYGDVFTVWIPFPTVVITGHEALKRTVIRDGDSYAGRPDTFVMILLVEGNYGLIFEDNAWYRSQRRFTIHTLKNLGVGKNAIKTFAHKVLESSWLELVKYNRTTEHDGCEKYVRSFPFDYVLCQKEHQNQHGHRLAQDGASVVHLYSSGANVGGRSCSRHHLSSDAVYNHQFAHSSVYFGLGLSGVEKDTITTLTHRTVDLLQQTNGEPIEIKNCLTNAVGNVIHQLAFGFVRSHDDKEIMRFQILLNEVFEHFNDPRMLLLDVMPFLRHFDRWLGLGIRSTLHGNDAILEFIHKQLDQHKRTINYDQEPTNYIDAYLHEIHRKKKEGVQDEFTEKQCIVAIYDLYSAGLETIVITLRYCFLYILNYPNIQEKIHNEIDNAIGRERDITMDDQKILPYTCAFLQEVYRAGYVLYANFLRMTLNDVDCEGYKLRSGTRVIPQFQSVHMDETIYPRPEVIIPERHLENGQFIKDDHINGFSVGKRACLGENLARMEVFMFFTSLMQKFRLEPEGFIPPDFEMLTSTFRAPLPFKIRALCRGWK